MAYQGWFLSLRSKLEKLKDTFSGQMLWSDFDSVTSLKLEMGNQTYNPQIG